MSRVRLALGPLTVDVTTRTQAARNLLVRRWSLPQRLSGWMETCPLARHGRRPRGEQSVVAADSQADDLSPLRLGRMQPAGQHIGRDAADGRVDRD